jgi:hypothetical protein
MKSIVLSSVLAFCFLSDFRDGCRTCAGQERTSISFELDAKNVLNQHADKVGIWVNSNVDHNDDRFIEALRNLNVRSIRYGWQFGLFDENDLSSQIHSPRDQKSQGYLASQNGRMKENFGPGGVNQMLEKIDATGFAVLSTDGINYIGKEDAAVAAMSRDARIAAYVRSSVKWASWATKNRFQFFEIGNENDMTGGKDQSGGVQPWKAPEYAQVAWRYLDEVKRVNPAAKCGINGGLLDAQKSDQWFRDIVAADPKLADDLDFIVAHKYEFWLDLKAWQAHADWDYGRLGVDYRNTIAACFPKLPVQVTELGSWKPGENTPHYRSVLATEMLGNVRMDKSVEHVQFWPTCWGNEGGVFQPTSDELSGMGLGMAAYTRFCESTMFANQVIGSVRCFAAKGDSKATLWLINHGSTPQEVNVTINDIAVDQENKVWRLESASGSPTANDTLLQECGSLETQETDRGLQFKIKAAPVSATIVRFEH